MLFLLCLKRMFISKQYKLIIMGGENMINNPVVSSTGGAELCEGIITRNCSVYYFDGKDQLSASGSGQKEIVAAKNSIIYILSPSSIPNHQLIGLTSMWDSSRRLVMRVDSDFRIGPA